MKIKLKNILMISFLAVAGIFGVSSAVINNQAKETPKAEKADAAVEIDGIYLKLNANWKSAGRYAIYVFGDNGNKWVSLLDAGSDYWYVKYADIKGYSTVIFCRMNGSNQTNDWSNRWDQSSNQSIPTATNKICYTLTAGAWGGTSGADIGTWGAYSGTSPSSYTFYFDKSNWSETIVPKLYWWTYGHHDTVVGTNIVERADGSDDYVNTKWYSFTFTPSGGPSLSGIIFFLGDNIASASKKTSDITSNLVTNNIFGITSGTSAIKYGSTTNPVICKVDRYRRSGSAATAEYWNSSYVLSGENFDPGNPSTNCPNSYVVDGTDAWYTSTSYSGTAYNSSNTLPLSSSDVNLYAKFKPNAGNVIANSKVRVWIGYDTSRPFYTSADSLESDGIRLWIHSTSSAGSEKIYKYTSGGVGTYNNGAQSNRRYDYFDVDLSCYTSGWYMNVQKFENGGWKGSTNPIQLSSSNVGKIYYVWGDWDWDKTQGTVDAGSIDSVDAQMAAWALQSYHTCSNSVYNGYGAINNYRDTFIMNGSSWRTVGNLSDYSMYDFADGDTGYTGSTNKAVNAYSKYEWMIYYKNGGAKPASALGNLGFLLGGQDNFSTIIIIISSSVALLSVTALSILVIRKRKSKEQE